MSHTRADPERALDNLFESEQWKHCTRTVIGPRDPVTGITRAHVTISLANESRLFILRWHCERSRRAAYARLYARLVQERIVRVAPS